MLKFIDDDLYDYFSSTEVGYKCLLLGLEMIPHIMLVDKNDLLYTQQGIREVHWNTKEDYIVYADLRLLYTFKFIDFDINNNVTVVIKWRGPKPIAYDALNLMYKSTNLILKTKLDKSYCFSFNSCISIDSFESIQSLLSSGASIKCDDISLLILKDKIIDTKYMIKVLNLLNVMHTKYSIYHINRIYLHVDENFLKQFDKMDKKEFILVYKTIKEKKFKNTQFYKEQKIILMTETNLFPAYLGLKNEFNHFLKEVIC